MSLCEHEPWTFDRVDQRARSTIRLMTLEWLKGALLRMGEIESDDNATLGKIAIGVAGVAGCLGHGIHAGSFQSDVGGCR
jgi:hypothetical protein